MVLLNVPVLASFNYTWLDSGKSLEDVWIRCLRNSVGRRA